MRATIFVPGAPSSSSSSRLSPSLHCIPLHLQSSQALLVWLSSLIGHGTSAAVVFPSQNSNSTRGRNRKFDSISRYCPSMNFFTAKKIEMFSGKMDRHPGSECAQTWKEWIKYFFFVQSRWVFHCEQENVFGIYGRRYLLSISLRCSPFALRMSGIFLGSESLNGAILQSFEWSIKLQQCLLAVPVPCENINFYLGENFNGVEKSIWRLLRLVCH